MDFQEVPDLMASVSRRNEEDLRHQGVGWGGGAGDRGASWSRHTAQFVAGNELGCISFWHGTENRLKKMHQEQIQTDRLTAFVTMQSQGISKERVTTERIQEKKCFIKLTQVFPTT